MRKIAAIIVLLLIAIVVVWFLKSSNLYNASISASVPNVNIVIESPRNGDSLTLPFEIKGQTKVLQKQFNYRIKDLDGNVITEGNVLNDAQGMLRVTVYKLPAKGEFTLEVYDYSPQDDTEADNTSLQITIQ